MRDIADVAARFKVLYGVADRNGFVAWARATSGTDADLSKVANWTVEDVAACVAALDDEQM